MSNFWQAHAHPIWQSNPLLTQCLGFCSILALTNSATQALLMGLIYTGFLMISNTLCTSLRIWLKEPLQLPLCLLLLAGLSGTLALLLQAYQWAFYEKIALYIALLAGSDLALVRAQHCIRNASIVQALSDGFFQGLGVLWVALLLGITRELLGAGQLFADWPLLWNGAQAAGWQLLAPHQAFIFAATPAGALILLGLLMALHNYCRAPRVANSITELHSAQDRRVRVTQVRL